LPGVISVLTGDNLPVVRAVFGFHVPDQPILAIGKVRHVGEPVAAVVAQDEATAQEAVRLISVEYEPLPFVESALEALQPDAPIVHEEPLPIVQYHSIGTSLGRSHPNVCAAAGQSWGDVDAAIRRAKHIVDGEYRFPMAYAYAMEPYVAIAAYQHESLTIWASTQHPYAVRRDIAECFGLPMSRVRIIVPYVGGGYGSKSFAKIEPLVSALAVASGRPVRLGLSVEEAMVTVRSDSAVVRLRTAFDQGGRILARDGTIYLDTGAYAASSPAVARAATVRIVGPYRVPSLRMEALAVYTNTAPASSFRGFGAQQTVWASEQQMDEAAEIFDLDPIELRMRNVLEPGERLWPGGRGIDADMRTNLAILRDELNKKGKTRGGRGVAVAISDAGFIPVSTAIVRVHADGSASLLTGATELGQGSGTALAQIAAGELGIPLERVGVVQSDTSVTPFEASTGASRTTTLAGRAVQAACRDARRQLRRWAAEVYDVPMRSVVDAVGGVQVLGQGRSWADVIREWFGASGGEIIGRGYIRKSGEFSTMPPFWEVGCVGVDVIVDEETGQISVERLVIVGDVGLAIHPQMAHGQDIGAAVMGLGLGTTEEIVYKDGSIQNLGLFDYRVPRARDVPEVVVRRVERRDGIGPYGAKGGGEGPLNPMAPALANAVAAGYGVRIREAPLTPERIWHALQSRGGSNAGGS
jgi:CO/xanthine dehydrogenase Mo-binding subunit